MPDDTTASRRSKIAMCMNLACILPHASTCTAPFYRPEVLSSPRSTPPLHARAQVNVRISNYLRTSSLRPTLVCVRCHLLPSCLHRRCRDANAPSRVQVHVGGHIHDRPSAHRLDHVRGDAQARQYAKSFVISPNGIHFLKMGWRGQRGQPAP